MTKEQKFSMLMDTVKYCNLCERLCSSTRVLSENNGNIHSNVLFVAEAPGRLGADKTKIPLFGDKAGNNFQNLIDTIGWRRDDFFITNAVLCNPKTSEGNNDKPSSQELINCSIYLQMLIHLMVPKYIVTLGQVALETLGIIEKHNLDLRTDIRKSVQWNNRVLIPLYHTSSRAMIHRSFSNQIADFYYIHKIIRSRASLSGKRTPIKLPALPSLNKFYPSKLQELVLYILKSVQNLSRFKLTKLAYLIDYEAVKQRRMLLTGAFYVRAYDGPMPTNLTTQLSQLEGKEVITYFRTKQPFVRLYSCTRFEPSFTDEECKLIDTILKKYENKGEKEIKSAVYLTTPMRRLLTRERTQEKMIGKPIFTEEDLNRLF